MSGASPTAPQDAARRALDDVRRIAQNGVVGPLADQLQRRPSVRCRDADWVPRRHRRPVRPGPRWPAAVCAPTIRTAPLRPPKGRLRPLQVDHPEQVPADHQGDGGRAAGSRQPGERDPEPRLGRRTVGHRPHPGQVAGQQHPSPAGGRADQPGGRLALGAQNRAGILRGGRGDPPPGAVLGDITTIFTEQVANASTTCRFTSGAPPSAPSAG